MPRRYEKLLNQRCRSIIAASFGESLEGGTRVARVRGKNIRVPADMNYSDYKRVYVDRALTLKDWQEKLTDKIHTANVYGAREDIIKPVAEKGRAQREAKLPKSAKEVLEKLKTYKIGTKTEAQILEQVNPKFSTGEYQWTHNCQRCVVAWELLQRGYDVTAKPYNDNDLIGGDPSAAWEFKHSFAKDPDVRFSIIKAWFKRDILRAFEEWGEGSRAMIAIKRKSGSKHVFVAKHSKRKTLYLDPQSGKELNIDTIVESCTSEQKQLWFMRLDNRQFSNKIIDAVENVE